MKDFEASAAFAERVLAHAALSGVTRHLSMAPAGMLAAAASPGASELNALLNNVGTAPGTTTVVTVPSAPVPGDALLIQNVQTLNAYIATLTALVMYNQHPEPYDLSNKVQATKFIADSANARNFVVTGGVVRAIQMYLPMGSASTQTFSKTTTTADLHLELLKTMFDAFGMTEKAVQELDAILTEIAAALKNLKISVDTETQTLNHFISFYHLVPVEGATPAVNQMNVDFLYLQIAQSSWEVAVGKSTATHFTLDMSLTRTSATMSAGLVAANTSSIVSSLMQLTGNDATAISNMTKTRGVRT